MHILVHNIVTVEKNILMHQYIVADAIMTFEKV